LEQSRRDSATRDLTTRLASALSVVAAWFLVLAAPATAEPRIALVIGNGAYQSVTQLDNPVSDGELMASTLQAVGFEVTLLVNGTQDEIKRAVAGFGRALRAAGPEATGLFYYAGHGVQSRGENYLLPVDGAIQDEADLDLVAVPADWVLRQLFSARNRTNIVILDACRNNPFETLGGTESGLAEMNAPTGTFIAYASAPGSVAMDGAAGTHSPFTKALTDGILVKGQPIEQVFKQVRVAVLDATGGQQTPWDSSSLTGEFYFEAAEPVDPRELAAEQLWNSVKDTGDPVQILLFLRQYPDARVSNDARAALQTALADTLAPGAPALAVPEVPIPAPAPPPVVQAPVPVEPAGGEEELIARAQASGAQADYEAYLAAYPEGVFADLARAEVDALLAKGTQPAPAPPAAPEISAPEVAAAPQPLVPEGQTITFLTPLSRGFEPIAGRSIAEIIEGSPQYPPVPGLPDSYWKDRQCKDCHQWTKEALCAQGQTYLTSTGEFALEKEHPLDGFKQVLRQWAAAGCQ